MTQPVDQPVDRREGPAWPSAGLLLLRGQLSEVVSWARRGIVPVAVAPLEGWTAVLPNGDSHAAAPYDDALTVLAARRVPPRLRPALGFFVIDGRAVITAQERPRRRRAHWVVWEPERGLVRPPGLDIAPPSSLLRIAGAGSRSELVEIMLERHIAPARMLAAVVAVLGLPGPRLLVDPAGGADLPGRVEREPGDRQVAWFEDAVRDSVLLRRELGHGR